MIPPHALALLCLSSPPQLTINPLLPPEKLLHAHISVIVCIREGLNKVD